MGSGQGKYSKSSPHLFPRRELHVSADSKLTLKENHRLQKMEHGRVVQKEVTAEKVDNLLAIMDAPVDIFAEEMNSNNIVRNEVAEENLSDLLACSEKLLPVRGQARPPKIATDSAGRGGLPFTHALAEKDLSNILSVLDDICGISKGTDDLPVTNPEEVLSSNDHSLQCSPWTLGLLDELQVGDDNRLLGGDQLHVTEREQTDKMLKADDHRPRSKLESEHLLQKEVAEENVSDLLVCSGELFAVSGQRRFSKISSSRSVCCFSWCCWCCRLPRWFASGRGQTKY